MNASFNYGISMQEAVRDICGETGKSELEVIEIIASILLGREDPYLTAYRVEAGLDQDVRIEAWRAAGALLAILEYPKECLFEFHIVKTGQPSLGDYVEVPIKYFRVSVARLTELLEAAEVFPIPGKWPGKYRTLPSGAPAHSSQETITASGERHQEVKKEPRMRPPGILSLVVDDVNRTVIVSTRDGKKTSYACCDIVGKGTVTWDLLVAFAKAHGSLEGNTTAELKKANTSANRNNLSKKLVAAMKLASSPIVEGRAGIMRFYSIQLAGDTPSSDAMDRKTYSIDDQATKLLSDHGDDMPINN